MNNVFTILRREYLERVRTRAFVISTIAAPLLMIALIAVPILMERNSEQTERIIVVVDATGTLGDRLAEHLRDAGYQVEIAPAGSSEAAAGRARAESGEIGAVLELDTRTLAAGSARWISRSPPPTARRFVILQAITRAALEARLGEPDAEIAELMAGGDLEFVNLRQDATDDEGLDREAGMAAAFVGGLLLYIVLLIYGSVVARAVLEEKTGRIVEIIISTVAPWQLLFGKIVGVGAVGLTQLTVWIGSAILLATFGLSAALPLLSDAGAIESAFQALPGVGVILFFLVSFVLGYFLYASFFAAVGAICSTEQETHQLQFPVVMLLIVAFFLLMPILNEPDTTFALVMSLVPLFSPILMFGRVAAGAAAPWEAVLAIALLVGAVFVSAWIVGRIYRVGILMQGKRPTLPELWRWLREA